MIVIRGGSNLLTRKKVDGVGHALVTKGFEIVNFLTTCLSKFTLLKRFQNVRASLNRYALIGVRKPGNKGNGLGFAGGIEKAHHFSSLQ